MKKIGLICLALVLALGALGIGYAQWTETLTINGTVDTGELDWEFVGANGFDTAAGENDWHCNDGFVGIPAYWQGDRDAGITSVAIVDPHTVSVTLDNVYPSYFTSVNLTPLNTGTVPLIVDTVNINGTTIRSTPSAVVKLDLGGDTNDDIEILWKDGFLNTILPGEQPDDMTFLVHVLGDAPQGGTLYFTIEIVGIQYNLYVPPLP